MLKAHPSISSKSDRYNETKLYSKFWGPEHNKSKSIGQHTGGLSAANHWYIMQDNARCCHITAKDKQCQQITIRLYALRKWWRDMIERNKNTFHRASIKILAPVPIVLRNIAGSKSKAHFELLPLWPSSQGEQTWYKTWDPQLQKELPNIAFWTKKNGQLMPK